MESRSVFKVGGVPEHFNLPWHLAGEDGDFEQAGVSVEYKDYPGGTGAMSRALASGELDLAIVLTEGIISAIHQGNPSRIIKSYIDSPLIWGIHVAANGKLQEEEDMEGKRFAISRFGSGSHLMAIVDAMQRGWDYEHLLFEKVGNLEGAIEALPDNKADVFLWERFSTQPFVDDGIFRRIGEIPTPWPSFMIAVREEVYEKRSKDLQKLLDVINRKCKELMRDPDAVKTIASRYDLEPEQVAIWFDLTKWSTDLSIPTQSLLKTQEALLNAGIIEKKMKLNKLCFVG
ncbi:MAG: substrate-binding domain-containing protein [Bacteroidia bacterium]|nr:substrate-binding domain-containing protein [Bacteroidia bacterium]